MKQLKLFISLLSLAGLVLLPAQDASAISGHDFKAGRIIDDGVFYNHNSMTVEQIQQFLNAKVPQCDRWGEKPYAGTTRRAYGESRGISFPLTCLKDYQENPSTGQNNLEGRAAPSGGKSAALIIWDEAQKYGINPQVLLTLLQKEQALVADDWPWPIQFKSATGYGCPDTAPCDSEYFGFYNQVQKAAWQFRRYATHQNDYAYISGRNNTILWNPNSSCGGSSVFIENQATAALYIYTPYRPNQAALDNLYGTGDGCSSYGNRNFWRYFNDWFGSTIYHGSTSIKGVKKRSYGNAHQVFATTDTQILAHAWWPGSGGVHRDIPVKAPPGEVIVDFDKINKPNSTTQAIYTATSSGVYETTWNGSGYSNPTKILTLPGIKKIIVDVKNEGGNHTYRLYVLANDGPYEYWWRDNTEVSDPYRFWNINHGLDMVKTVDPNGRDELYVATSSSTYRIKWPIGGDIQRTTVNNIVSTVGVDKQTLGNGVELLYTITQTGVHETWWKDDSGFSDHAKIVDRAGGPQVVDAKKTITNGWHQLYVSTKKATYEYWWKPGQSISAGRLIGRDLIVEHDKSTNGNYQNLYTTSPTAIYETWWGNGLFGTGAIAKYE
jgi:hypothetical protein